jgi:hypothetical protein
MSVRDVIEPVREQIPIQIKRIHRGLVCQHLLGRFDVHPGPRSLTRQPYAGVRGRETPLGGQYTWRYEEVLAEMKALVEERRQSIYENGRPSRLNDRR